MKSCLDLVNKDVTLETLCYIPTPELALQAMTAVRGDIRAWDKIFQNLEGGYLFQIKNMLLLLKTSSDAFSQVGNDIA